MLARHPAVRVRFFALRTSHFALRTSHSELRTQNYSGLRTSFPALPVLRVHHCAAVGGVVERPPVRPRLRPVLLHREPFPARGAGHHNARRPGAHVVSFALSAGALAAGAALVGGDADETLYPVPASALPFPAAAIRR